MISNSSPNDLVETLVIITGDCGQKTFDYIENKFTVNKKVVFIAELAEHIVSLSLADRKKFILLDELRDESTTIRSAADTADFTLKNARPYLEGCFSYEDKSLWLANETNFLHFHLLRLIDYINVLKKAFSVYAPDNIYCVGPITQLTKVSDLVATENEIHVTVINDMKLMDKVSRFIWWSQKLISKFPKFHITVLYITVYARDILFSRQRDSNKAVVSNTTVDLNKDGKVVTLLSTNRKQSDIILRIYEYLRKIDGYDCRILNIKDHDLYKKLKEQNLCVFDIKNYLFDIKSIKKSARKIFYREALSVFGSKDFRSIFKHAGISYWSISGDHFIRNILTNAPHLFSLVEGGRTFFKMFPADIVITPGEWDSESRAIMSAASLQGAKTISVQRGDITDFPGWGGPLFSDVMTVNGLSVEKALISLGVDEKSIIVTGDPRLDKWVSSTDEIFTENAIKSQLSIPDGKKLIAVMTNPVNLNEKASHAEAYISGLIEAGGEDDSLYFVIKLHPSENDLDFYRRIQDRYQHKNSVVVKEMDTPQLLHEADVVITTISTTGEEAIFMGKPLIVINLTNEPDFMPYVGHPAAITVRKRNDIPMALRNAISDKDTSVNLSLGRESYIKDHFYAADGGSTKRLEQVLNAF